MNMRALLLAAALIAAPASAAEAPGSDPGWSLVWSDEFDGASLDASTAAARSARSPFQPALHLRAEYISTLPAPIGVAHRRAADPSAPREVRGLPHAPASASVQGLAQGLGQPADHP